MRLIAPPSAMHREAPMWNDPRDEVERLADDLELSARASCAEKQTCGIMDHAASVLRSLNRENAALREKLEAAEAERDEARAGQAAAWEAGRDAAFDAILKHHGEFNMAIFMLEPPDDLTAALAAHDQRVRDAEREAVAYYIGAVPRELPYRQEHMEAIRTGRYLNHVNMTDFRALKKGGET